MKVIIYCRKSTDRGDRQQLSISAQESEARRIAKREGFEIVEIFRETKSAKEPGRPLFNEMMRLFNKGKADCIITWKLNRLARNPVDEGTIKWSIQNGIIKAIYTEGEVFKTGDNVLIMGMHFGMSTQYILELQRDIKRGMKKKMENGGVCQKAPLGYINNKIEKTVEVDKIKSEWVKEIFKLRSENIAFKTITEILYKKGITKDNGDIFPTTTIETLVKNKFYIGLVRYNGIYYKGNYKTFISNRLFEKANTVGQGISYKLDSSRICYLKGLLKDRKGYLLSGYIKKGHIYYKSNVRCAEKVNINQNIIFKHFEDELKEFEMDKKFKDLNKEIILEILENQKPKDFETIKEINLKIKKLLEQKEKLLDLRIEGEINKNIYLEKNNDIIFKIADLETKKNELKNNNIKEKLNLMFELVENLYISYNLANDELKSIILKNLMFELFINNKKELSYAENSLLNSLKILQNIQKNIMEVPSGIEPLGKVLQTRV